MSRDARRLVAGSGDGIYAGLLERCCLIRCRRRADRDDVVSPGTPP
jgi:hypothetical protein